ncbi:uncharacterized protein LOC109711608 [Ananas comosus]|uniref:Uncharacterized protein LOC109711608 n=1 Tax=Ananas comosus TaxID=4615 RepID=A0A6P5F2H3_ANACO|nr:uncharacterized protein LOC109711608 [Ananas comosus]
MSSSSSSSCTSGQLNVDNPVCFCGLKASQRTSLTFDNPGRRFYGCINYKRNSCDFFRWRDPEICERGKEYIIELLEQIGHLKKKVIALENEISTTPEDNYTLRKKLTNIENSRMALREEMDRLIAKITLVLAIQQSADC